MNCSARTVRSQGSVAVKKCSRCGATYRGAPEICPLDGASLLDAADPHLARRLGGWLLCELLAEGPWARVYRAERGGVSGALKLYRRSDSLDRAWREAAAQGKVSHPNVAALLDKGRTADGEFFLVSEFVRGQTLGLTIAQSGAFAAPVAVRIAEQAAAGLGAIHQQGVVHRDIKPKNLMVLRRPAPEPFALKILDLGHALALDLGRLTDSGLVWGSAAYMSPEQAAGDAVDQRSDLYSLGVVLYELLVGRRPFEAKAAVDLMQMHGSCTARHPSESAEMDPRLGDLCMWLLAKQPSARPASAAIVRSLLCSIYPDELQVDAKALRASGEGGKMDAREVCDV